MQKPNIVLVVDELGWCYSNVADAISSNLQDKYTFTKITIKEKLPSHYDLVHYATYALIPLVPASKNKSICGLVGVHGRDIQTVVDCLARCKMAAYRSDYMYDKFKPLTCTPLVYIPDAIDTNIFVSKEKEPNRTLKVGWVGNSHKKDKRFREIEAALKTVPAIIFEPFKRKDGKTLPYSDLPRYYQHWDCYVCYSTEEGFCIPLIEAASSGLPIISTDVGCARKIDGAIIIHSIKELTDAVEFLRDRRDTAVSMGARARRSVVRQFDWKIVAPLYSDFFQQNL